MGYANGYNSIIGGIYSKVMGDYFKFKGLTIGNITYRERDTIPCVDNSVEEWFIEGGSTRWEWTRLIITNIAHIIKLTLS